MSGHGTFGRFRPLARARPPYGGKISASAALSASALPGLAVDDRDAVHARPGFQPAGEPAGHPHQVRVVELIVGATVQYAATRPGTRPGCAPAKNRRSARSGPHSHKSRSADLRSARRNHQPRTERATLTAGRQPNCPKGHSFRAKSRTERSDPWSVASPTLSCGSSKTDIDLALRVARTPAF